MMPGSTDGGGGNPISMFIPIIGMLVIFYFLLIAFQHGMRTYLKAQTATCALFNIKFKCYHIAQVF